MNQSDMWKQTISFYEDLLEKNWDVKPQIELIKEIAETDYSKSFYPTTSHDILCLSTQDSYIKSQDFPMISIQYIGNQLFKIKFWEKPTRTHNVVTYDVPITGALSLLKSLFLRLSSGASESLKTFED